MMSSGSYDSEGAQSTMSPEFKTEYFILLWHIKYIEIFQLRFFFNKIRQTCNNSENEYFQASFTIFLSKLQYLKKYLKSLEGYPFPIVHVHFRRKLILL